MADSTLRIVDLGAMAEKPTKQAPKRNIDIVVVNTSEPSDQRIRGRVGNESRQAFAADAMNSRRPTVIIDDA